MTAEKIYEYKRTCNKCGKIWHSLVAREKDIEAARKINTGLVWMDACCGDSKTDRIVLRQDVSQTNAYDKDVHQMRRCPECQSTDYKETIVSHVKK